MASSVPSFSDPRELTRLFRILSDDTRFRLLRLLWREELTVNELAVITQLAQPRISNHLKILREENLITERRSGSWRFYRMEKDELPAAARNLWPALEDSWKEAGSFAADDKRLAEVLVARSPDARLGFFDALAGEWDEYRDRLFGDALGREILRAFLPSGLVVADIGTGTGYILHLFGSRAKKLIAVDNSEGMLALAKEKARAAGLKNLEFRLADAGQNPLKANEADVITLVQVMQHLEDPAGVIAGLAKGLRKDGRLIISDFLEHEEHWLRSALRHRWSGFSREKLSGWLKDAGLRLVSWEILPGRHLTSPEGHRVRVPDGFTAVAHR